jgi:heptosyltransferase-2
MSKSLIIAPNWIGDAVMSEPLIRRLKDFGGDITVLATPWVAPVYRSMPAKPNVIEMAFSHGKIELSKRINLAKHIKMLGFDQAILLPNSWKSILIPVLAQIPEIFAYKGELRSLFITKSLENPPKKNRPPMVNHYLNLANLIRTNSVNLNETNRPRLEVDDSLTEKLSNIRISPLFYILAPGAEYGPAKQWPVNHFGELAIKLLHSAPSSDVVLMGSSKDTLICEQILQFVDKDLHHRIKNLAGVASLDQSISIISKASGLASNDSGLMHIAAALEIPQIAFYGSSDPKHTPPLSPFAGVLFLGLDCSPCHQRKCPLGHLNCLNQIKPQAAFNELQRCITLRESN